MKKFFACAIVFFDLVFLTSCGDGDFRVNPTAGSLSEVGLDSDISPSTDPIEYFNENLFLRMTANTGNKGCISCHPLNPSRPTYFQVDASSSTNTYNWAGARRKRLSVGDYASSSSSLIIEQMEANHPGDGTGFSAWTVQEKAQVTVWDGLD